MKMRKRNTLWGQHCKNKIYCQINEGFKSKKVGFHSRKCAA